MNNEELRELRRRAESIDAEQVRVTIILGETEFNLSELVELAQLAVLPSDAEPTTDSSVTFGEWTTLRTAKNGDLVENRKGARLVVTDDCKEEFVEVVNLIHGHELRLAPEMRVRQIHLPPPAPVAPPQEPVPSLEERVADIERWIETVNAGLELLAERAAATQGTAGG